MWINYSWMEELLQCLRIYGIKRVDFTKIVPVPNIGSKSSTCLSAMSFGKLWYTSCKKS